MDPQVPWIVKTKACSSPRPSSSRRPASPSLRRPVLVALAIAWSRARPTCSAVVPASTRATSTPRVEIVFPVHGGLVAQSFQPQFALHVADKRMLEEHLDTIRLCYAVGDAAATCVGMGSVSTLVEDATPGPAVLIAWVSDARTGGVLSDQTSSVIFEVVSDDQRRMPITGEAGGQQPLPLDSVLSWYQRLRKPPPPPPNLERGYSMMMRKRGLGAGVDGSFGPPRVSKLTSTCWDEDASLLAVVGIKSAVGNFDRRQAVRETWAQADLGPLSGRVCLLFVTGRAESEVPRGAAAALALETAVYGDLFGTGFSTEKKGEKGADGSTTPSVEVVRASEEGANEATVSSPPGKVLGVRDGYDNLIEKTVRFMETAMDEMPHYEYLVMMDDDVYLRLDQLGDWLDKRVPRVDEKGFYAGQVWADQFGRPIQPQRYPATKNAISRETWPLDVLPPFAIGSHYILSRDCVEFITDNKSTLRAVGTLEDVSIALWMLALQVHPLHLDGFTDAKAGGCLDHATSLASVGPNGIRAAHANVAAGKPLCHGFDPETWQVM